MVIDMQFARKISKLVYIFLKKHQKPHFGQFGPFFFSRYWGNKDFSKKFGSIISEKSNEPFLRQINKERQKMVKLYALKFNLLTTNVPII